MAVLLCHLTKNLKIGCGFKIAPMWCTLWLAEDYAQSRDSIMALGLLKRDGFAVGLGLAIAAVAAAVVTIGSAGVVHWIHSQIG